MKDRTGVIFGNVIDAKTVRAAEKSKAKYIKKFGDDEGTPSPRASSLDEPLSPTAIAVPRHGAAAPCLPSSAGHSSHATIEP